MFSLHNALCILRISASRRCVSILAFTFLCRAVGEQRTFLRGALLRISSSKPRVPFTIDADVRTISRISVFIYKLFAPLAYVHTQSARVISMQQQFQYCPIAYSLSAHFAPKLARKRHASAAIANLDRGSYTGFGRRARRPHRAR